MNMDKLEECVGKAIKKAYLDYAVWGEGFIHIYTDEDGTLHVEAPDYPEGHRIKEQMEEVDGGTV